MDKHKLNILFSAVMVLAIIIAVFVVIAQADNVSQYQRDKIAAHEAAELMRSYGYPEDNPVIQAASKWWWATDDLEKYSAVVENPTVKESAADLHEETIATPEPVTNGYYTDDMYTQYPVACEIYAYLRGTMGLSHAVASGIIGGWMEEAGGQTLSIDPNLWVGSGYYAYGGIAMWSLYYCPEVYGLDLYGQLNYFANTAKTNIEAFGGSYDYFCSLTEPSDVVWYYYTYYGRGYGGPSWQRIQNGEYAYEYFGGM